MIVIRDEKKLYQEEDASNNFQGLSTPPDPTPPDPTHLAPIGLTKSRSFLLKSERWRYRQAVYILLLFLPDEASRCSVHNENARGGKKR